MPKKKSIVPVGKIEQRILLIRGEKVIVDADLAEFYGVQTKVLNQAVKRNKDRFPEDFMFRLTKVEKVELVTNCDHLEKLKFSPTTPQVFTEHGAILGGADFVNWIKQNFLSKDSDRIKGTPLKL